MKTILITGINGFLGSHLAVALSSEYNIIGLEYSLENLYRIEHLNFKLYSTKNGINQDIFTDQKIDIILHTATLYGKNNEDIIQMFNANLYLPLNLLDYALKYGCQLFINTDTVLDRFVSSYALTKRQFQEWLYFRKNAIKITNMRLEHFYGPGASNLNFITSMISRLENNEPQIDLTLGEQKRNFVYIEDVVSAFLTVIKKQHLLENSYTSFQVCTDQLVSIKELVVLLKKLTKSRSALNFGAVPYRENELMHSEANNSDLLSLGWTPIYSIEDGLKLTYKMLK